MSSQPGPRAVIVLAAGAGTRMRSATPKVLHRIGGRSLLAHAVIAAAGSGAEHVVVVVGHARERVAAELDAVATRHGIVVSVAVQEQQRGTGDAVAAGVAGLPADARGTVVVTSGDVPLLSSDTLTALVAEHSGGAATILTTVLTDPTGYGRVLRDADGFVRAVVEEADATPVQREITEVNGGVYAFDLSVLRTTLGRLTSENAQGERYLPDVLALARRDGHPVGALSVADPWLLAGVNDRVQLSAAGAELNRRTLERWMRQGVTVRDTANTWVDVEVELAADVELLPGTQLCGRTSVGGRARIGPDTTLTDVTVGEDAEVVRTHSDAAVIGAGVKVGPFAYLRPGTHLHAGARIGTFVETKNAVVGAGSKVPHLTYVGDATIGEHSNIGASSVFVNYDGVQKRRTVIGSHVRTGSDTMFIAPVEVGDGAYTGAGTVVREDVPAGALAVSGGPQRTIPNWVLVKRPGTPAAEAAQRAQAPEQNGDLQ